MISGNIKKIILAFLFVVLIYIWGKNLYLFTGGGTSDSFAETKPLISSTENGKSYTVSYRQPKINPFRRPDVPVSPPVKTRSSPKNETPPIPNKISQEYFLSGVVNRPPHSQAVLRNSRGESRVISLGDSLDVWALTTIASSYVIFTSEQHRDSLGLVD